ncbi:hypothetical protein [Paraburkholderia strydomiana]|uniref:hypothetical protein n=1 Tax=Paraburkholderia strydomiana TaxID=1245417 RepID=UPI0028561313|nr:hypothetical protein [Paraburkholderia strydomiana]MDR7008926.1 L-alanine-DL-glutamate epimerase-like enolase superfamily enzyme [Paraburkholderia strydomiana]
MLIEQITNHLLHFPLRSPVGGSGVSAVDVLTTQLSLASGAKGLGFSFVLVGAGKSASCCAELLAAAMVGTHLHHPAAAWRAMRATLNRIGRGPTILQGGY